MAKRGLRSAQVLIEKLCRNGIVYENISLGFHTGPSVDRQRIALLLSFCHRKTFRTSFPVPKGPPNVGAKDQEMATKLIKNTYVKDILRQHSGASQVGEDALERVDQLFQEFLIKMSTAAADSLQKDDRSKVAAEDVDFGFNSIMGQSGVAPEPVRFMEALHKMEIPQLGEILRLIVDWNNTDGKKKH